MTHRLVKAMPPSSISNLKTIDLSITRHLHRVIITMVLQTIDLSSIHRRNKAISSKATLHKTNRTFLI
jgi:hypothetical protein